MESVDGNEVFDFEGVYTEVVQGEQYVYVMSDGRTVTVSFTDENNQTVLTEVFDPETENPIEMQQAGWQSILNNFKQYAEKTYAGQQGSDGGFFSFLPWGGGKDSHTNDGGAEAGSDSSGDSSGGDGGGGGD